jgi:hypothetical protein
MTNQPCSLRASFVRRIITDTEAEKSVIYGAGKPDLSRGKGQFRRRIELNDASGKSWRICLTEKTIQSWQLALGVQPLAEAGARHEWTLEAVGWTPVIE